MRRWSRYLVGVVAVTGLLVPARGAVAETCSLKMRKVGSTSASAGSRSVESLASRTYPQSFFQQLGGPQGMIVGRSTGAKPKFSAVIKKEPAKYVTDNPFRGVAKLGSQHFGFVLDVAPPKEDEEKKEEDAGKQAKKADKEQSEGGLLSMLSRAFVPSASAPSKATTVSYSRLYFDRNHNGDLTDDEVIEATSSRAYTASHWQAIFPPVALTIEVEGQKVDYAFTFNVYSHASSSYSYANASLNAAAYREGEIQLDGKKRRVLLVDLNSNGRFDDAASVDGSRRSSSGTVYPNMGDMLYLDPELATSYRNAYDPTSGRDQHYVGKMVNIDGRFFNLTIDPSGETLTLEPSSAPVGHVTNPTRGFRALVYGDQGMLEIAPDETGKAPLPQGAWKLLSYTIFRTEPPPPEEDKEDAKREQSLLEVLGSVLPTRAATSAAARRPTLVAARATADFEPVNVVEGKTVELPFGPPYTPKVDAAPRGAGQTMSLSMSLVGCGGEVCTSLRVDGRTPPAPEFTISTADGEQVTVGKFKYG